MKDKDITIHIRHEKELTPEQLKKREAHKKHLRIISAIVFLLALAGISYLLIPIFQGLGEDGWAEQVRERISSHGTVAGLLIFLAIQALQVVVAVVPAIQAVGGVLYGSFFGSLLSFGGILLGTLIVWWIVKRLGKPLVEAAIGEKHIKKFGFLQDENRLILVLIILYIIPGVPKDVLTYIVPLTDIKMKDFFLYVLPFRLPAIMLTAALGSNVTKGNYGAAIAVVSVIVVIAVLGLIFKDKVLEVLSSRKSKK